MSHVESRDSLYQESQTDQMYQSQDLRNLEVISGNQGYPKKMKNEREPGLSPYRSHGKMDSTFGLQQRRQLYHDQLDVNIDSHLNQAYGYERTWAKIDKLVKTDNLSQLDIQTTVDKENGDVNIIITPRGDTQAGSLNLKVPRLQLPQQHEVFPDKSKQMTQVINTDINSVFSPSLQEYSPSQDSKYLKPANYLPQHFSTHETPLNNFPTGNLDSTKSDAKTHLPSKLSELARLGKEALEQEQIFGEKKSKLYAENHDQYKGRTDASDRLKKSIDSYDQLIMIEGLDIELPGDISKSVNYKYSIQKAEGYQSGNSPHSKYTIRTKTDEGFALSKDSDQKGPRGLIKGRAMFQQNEDSFSNPRYVDHQRVDNVGWSTFSPIQATGQSPQIFDDNQDPESDSSIEKSQKNTSKDSRELILIEGYDTKDLTTVNETNEQSSTVQFSSKQTYPSKLGDLVSIENVKLPGQSLKSKQSDHSGHLNSKRSYAKEFHYDINLRNSKISQSHMEQQSPAQRVTHREIYTFKHEEDNTIAQKKNVPKSQQVTSRHLDVIQKDTYNANEDTNVAEEPGNFLEVVEPKKYIISESIKKFQNFTKTSTFWRETDLPQSQSLNTLTPLSSNVTTKQEITKRSYGEEDGVTTRRNHMSGFTDLSISTNTKRILGTDYLEDSSGKREELHLQLTKVTKELDLIAENQRNLTTQKALKSTNQKVEKYQDLTLDIEKIEEEARSLKDLDQSLNQSRASMDTPVMRTLSSVQEKIDELNNMISGRDRSFSDAQSNQTDKLEELLSLEDQLEETIKSKIQEITQSRTSVPLKFLVSEKENQAQSEWNFTRSVLVQDYQESITNQSPGTQGKLAIESSNITNDPFAGLKRPSFLQPSSTLPKNDKTIQPTGLDFAPEAKSNEVKIISSFSQLNPSENNPLISVPSEDQKDVTFKKKKETSSVFDSLKKSLLNSSLILNHSKLKHSPQFKNGAEKENLPTMSLQYQNTPVNKFGLHEQHKIMFNEQSPEDELNRKRDLSKNLMDTVNKNKDLISKFS